MVENAPGVKALIYEMVDGHPIYFRGYKEVLEGRKSAEGIRGSNLLQSRLLTGILFFLGQKKELEEYLFLPNRVGLQIDEHHWRVVDLAIISRAALGQAINSTEYLKTPPQIVLEVDMKAGREFCAQPLGYWESKIKALHKFGVEKVIWIFTDSKRVLIADQGEDWPLSTWDKDVELMPGIQFQVQEILEGRLPE